MKTGGKHLRLPPVIYVNPAARPLEQPLRISQYANRRIVPLDFTRPPPLEKFLCGIMQSPKYPTVRMSSPCPTTHPCGTVELSNLISYENCLLSSNHICELGNYQFSCPMRNFKYLIFLCSPYELY